MRAADSGHQLALLRAHPELADRLARQSQLTAESTREQAGVGLDRLAGPELEEFQKLNDAYRQKFYFPFIICARLNARDAILAAMRARLANSPEVEHTAALDEIGKIAWLRLQDSLGTPFAPITPTG
jgi:2-oxo-4-hydroxy-4-carboxy-5-ureidoimidazoline decarboxylase